MGRQGSKVAFISDPPHEGFEAVVMIDGAPYRVRIMGTCKAAPTTKKRHYLGRVTGTEETTDKFRQDFQSSEERRIWRVVFYHLKSVFEASDSGVMELRELLLPHIVTSDGHTVAEHILPKLAQAIAGNPSRLLPSYQGGAHDSQDGS
jgi:hypothetical protein